MPLEALEKRILSESDSKAEQIREQYVMSQGTIHKHGAGIAVVVVRAGIGPAVIHDDRVPADRLQLLRHVMGIATTSD